MYISKSPKNYFTKLLPIKLSQYEPSVRKGNQSRIVANTKFFAFSETNFHQAFTIIITLNLS